MDKVSVSHLISFSKYRTKCVIQFFLRQLVTSQTFKIFLEATAKAVEGKTKIQNCEYLKNGKSFLDEIKNVFHSF